MESREPREDEGRLWLGNSEKIMEREEIMERREPDIYFGSHEPNWYSDHKVGEVYRKRYRVESIAGVWGKEKGGKEMWVYSAERTILTIQRL